jgi:hypothetical protein
MTNHLEIGSDLEAYFKAEEVKEHISKFFADKSNDTFEDFRIGYQMSGCIDSHTFKISINTYTHIYQRNTYGGNGPMESPPIKHSLTIPMLHCIKSIFTRGISCPSEGIRNIIENMLQNPQYFMTSCVEFEETCKKEYAIIKEQKEELERVIEEQNKHKEELERMVEEQVENREYYRELEKKIGVIEYERQKIQEERARMLAVKQKLDLMKQELQLERDAFEKEKKVYEIKNIDLDDYFEIPVATVVATKVSPTIGETILGEYTDL